MSKKYIVILTLFIGLLHSVVLSGCEPYQEITFDNQTQFVIKVDLSLVATDYSDIPTLTWKDSGDILEAGQSKTLVTSVPDTKEGGKLYKYAIVAVNDADQIIYAEVFTWEELHDMKWKVVITP